MFKYVCNAYGIFNDTRNEIKTQSSSVFLYFGYFLKKTTINSVDFKSIGQTQCHPLVKPAITSVLSAMLHVSRPSVFRKSIVLYALKTYIGIVAMSVM